MVAADGDRRGPHEQIGSLRGSDTTREEIAEVHDEIDLQGTNFVEHCFEGEDVPVDVGNGCYPHKKTVAAPPKTVGRIIIGPSRNSEPTADRPA